jgi:serine/threonine protein kinase/tetratricopeptide (TPR) repeat protein
MAHPLAKHPSADILGQAADSASFASASGEDQQFATCVVAVKPQQAVAEHSAPSWESSAKSSGQGPEPMQLFVDLHRSDPEACHHLAGASTALPEVGTELLGFRLLAELGRGAFGRVYLAQQDDLASRAVVLKVSPCLDNEPRALAQLQHTNIVPVYSVHRAGPLQAVCMPYFGSTTLDHVLRHLDDRKSLPQSGKELISTIVARKQTALDGASSAVPGVREQGPESGNSGAMPAPGLCPPVAGPGQPAHLEALQQFSYVEAVLWIGSCLADGLAHAHERGILHRDLKPANILLTDDGQPMLLDFNLAQDTKLTNRATTAQVGGTVPYMAPEQIEAFRTQSVHLDLRSDIYSLGVILYKLLTGRPPFPTPIGTMKQVLAKMLEDRSGPAPAVRCWNRAVSPAVESIVRRCLEPDPNRRYQSARQLKEDLDRQREDRPLRHAAEPSLCERARKWRRRHPLLTSTTTVVALAGLLIAAVLSVAVVRGQRLAEMGARESLSAFLEGKKNVQYLLTARADDPAQIDRGARLGRELLARYGDLDRGPWPTPRAVRHLSAEDQALLRQNGSELFLLLARGVALQALNQPEGADREKLLAEALRLNEQAESCGGEGAASRALLAQRAEVLGLLGRSEEAREVKARARATPLRGPGDHYRAAAEEVARGHYQDALPLLASATAQDPQDFWAWFLRGVCHDHLAQSREAIACYDTCVALAPRSAWAYLNRGLTHLRQHDYSRAAADLDRALELQPGHVEAHQNRAMARQGLKQYDGAVADLTRALELGGPPTHLYFLRASVKERAGDAAGAKRDRAAGLRRPPTDEMGWLVRGYARINADPRAALADFDQALRLNARSLAALQNKAHILSKLGRNEEAIRALDRLVGAYPDFVPARAGRGVLLARLGRREAAHKDAVDCLARDNKPLTLYQLAGVYALTSQKRPDDRAQAFRLLSIALQKGCGFDLLETDRDLDPIRRCPEFQRLVAAARAIRAPASATGRDG